MKARDLEEVREEAERMQLEPKIEDLVIGLRRWGIKTEMSCQGHFDSRYRFPWIHISREDLEGLNKLVVLILAWRDPLKSPWVLKPFWGFWQLQPEAPHWWKLRKFQREAMDFGKFLQELSDDELERRFKE